MPSERPAQSEPSKIFQKAVEKFEQSLEPKQRLEFSKCSLEDVQSTVCALQTKHGDPKNLRNMARLGAFLEAMDQYRKVVEPFLNCTPFLGYVWGPIRFVLLVTDTWVKSLDLLLDAYAEIAERLPSFKQYESLFERDSNMRRALELYYCDILEFHLHALHVVSRPGWKRLFQASWKTFETQFRRILDSLGRHKDLIDSEKGTIAIFEAHKQRELLETHFQEMDSLERKRRLAAVHEKLNATDYTKDHAIACEHHEANESGLWIREDPKFKEWHQMDPSQGPLLYVHGVPGAGKTALASAIINFLRKSKQVPVIYFYCKHNQTGKTQLNDVLRALLTQILFKDDTLLVCFEDKCASKDATDMTSILKELVEFALDTQDHSFIIIDGLDECESVDLDVIITYFMSLQQNRRMSTSGHLSMAFVGQRIEALERKLSSAISISLENCFHQQDVRRYIETQVRRIRDEMGLSPETEAVMVERVACNSKSMFLFASLVMEHLSCQTRQIELERELELDVFPVDLEDAYGRISSRVFRSNSEGNAASQIIGWVLCARRPLTWREIQATFYIDTKTSTSDFQKGRLRKNCKRLCSSLIDLQSVEGGQEEDATLQLVHETAREYLIRRGLINQSMQQIKSAVLCMEYLMTSPFQANIDDDALEQHIRAGYFALQDYAVSNWLNHYKESQNIFADHVIDAKDSLEPLAHRFLEEYGSVDSKESSLHHNTHIYYNQILGDLNEGPRTWHRLLDLEKRTSYIRSRIEAIRTHISNEDSVDMFRKIYGILTYKCTRIGCDYFTIGFSSKAERDEHTVRHRRPFACGEEGCPSRKLKFETKEQLSTHIQRHHITMEQNSTRFPRRKARNTLTLAEACAKGHVGAVRSILDSNAHLDASATWPIHSMEESLYHAIRNHNLHICKMLVESGADVNCEYVLPIAKDIMGTPLIQAVCNKDIEIMNFLLFREDIDVAAKNSTGLSALRSAVDLNLPIFVEMLLATGKTELSIPDDYTERYRLFELPPQDSHDHILWTALQVVDGGRESQLEREDFFARKKEVLRILHSTGMFDEKRTYKHDMTVFDLLVNRRNAFATELLLSANVFLPSSKNSLDLDAIVTQVLAHRAAMYGRHLTMEWLLGTNEAIFNSTFGHNDTALTLAAGGGHIEVVKLLLRSEKVGVNRRNAWGNTAIAEAAAGGYWRIVDMLLKTGRVDPNIQNVYGLTPISKAVEGDRFEVIKLLLQTDRVDPNLPDNRGETPVSKAAHRGYHYATARLGHHDEVMQLLLETDKVDPNLPDNSGETPISIAAARGHFGLVRQLLSTNKVDADSRDNQSSTPLIKAASNGHSDIVEQLMQEDCVNLNWSNSGGLTPLSAAIEAAFSYRHEFLTHESYADQLDTVRHLLESARIDEASIMEAYRRTTEENEHIVSEIFVETSKYYPEFQKYCLNEAVEWGRHQVVSKLLETTKIDPDIPYESEITPLNMAISLCQFGVAKAFAKSGRCNPLAADENGLTPLYKAAQSGEAALVQMLLETGKVDSESAKHSLRVLAEVTGSSKEPILDLDNGLAES